MSFSHIARNYLIQAAVASKQTNILIQTLQSLKTTDQTQVIDSYNHILASRLISYQTTKQQVVQQGFGLTVINYKNQANTKQKEEKKNRISQIKNPILEKARQKPAITQQEEKPERKSSKLQLKVQVPVESISVSENKNIIEEATKPEENNELKQNILDGTDYNMEVHSEPVSVKFQRLFFQNFSKIAIRTDDINMLLNYEKDVLIKGIQSKDNKKQNPKTDFRRQISEILEAPDFQFNQKYYSELQNLYIYAKQQLNQKFMSLKQLIYGKESVVIEESNQNVQLFNKVATETEYYCILEQLRRQLANYQQTIEFMNKTVQVQKEEEHLRYQNNDGYLLATKWLHL